MRTIAVIEREYRAELKVAGGPDTVLFNRSTRLARDLGGNEYDAAAIFLFTDMALRAEAEQPLRIPLQRLAVLTDQLEIMMNQPAVVSEVIERCLSGSAPNP
jgi:hypothetical protein